MGCDYNMIPKSGQENFYGTSTTNSCISCNMKITTKIIKDDQNNFVRILQLAIFSAHCKTQPTYMPTFIILSKIIIDACDIIFEIIFILKLYRMW